jgi:uncharacterized protein YoaH (UPF0181 family)
MGNHSCWNHFRTILNTKDLSRKQQQHLIDKRRKELMEEGYPMGYAVWIAVKEVKWDADIVKRL